MAYLDDLVTTRDSLVALRLASSASPKPSYNVHGHSVSWVEYLKYLSDEIDRLNAQIAQASPFEIVSQGIT